MGEDGRRQEVGGCFAGDLFRVVPATCGQGVREPGVDVALYVRPGAAGEPVADGFVALPRFGLLQGAELAERLELVGSGRDPGRGARCSASRSLAAAASAASSARTTTSPSGAYTSVVPASSAAIRSHSASSPGPRTSVADASRREVCRRTTRVSSSAARASVCVMPLMRRRTERRPTRAQSTGSPRTVKGRNGHWGEGTLMSGPRILLDRAKRAAARALYGGPLQ